MTERTPAPHRDGQAGRALLVAALLLAIVAAGGLVWTRLPRDPAPVHWTGPAPELWFYQGVNLTDERIVERLAPIWRRARAAGYTRVVLSDAKFGRLGDMNPSYFDNARRLHAFADSIGLRLVPTVFEVGRSNPTLAGNPNLAEGLPVEGALFEVAGGVLRLVPDPPVDFPEKPAGHDWEAGVLTHDASIHNNLWRARWWYDLAVHPHREYRISSFVRTQSFHGRPFIRVVGDGVEIHNMKTLGVDHDQDWTERDIVFNSLEHSKIRVYFGLWHHARGRIDFRDWRIQEVGPVNLLRRAGAPFRIWDDRTGRTLVEGRDYEPVADTLLGRRPWVGQFEEWHAPPVIRTSLPAGTRLRASWMHAAIVFDRQVSLCLAEPETFTRLQDEARRMRELWGPGRYLMSFDEIRALGRDSSCIRTGLSPGRILAQAAQVCAGYLPQDTLYVWNDMFDPYHNAVKDYFLVQGSLEDSWKGLGPHVSVVNWNAGKAKESLRFFAGQGRHQVLAGYYDGKPRDVRDWLTAASGVPNIDAVMYTTWMDRYDDLEAFADEVRADTHP
jgi:hypothetical protein